MSKSESNSTQPKSIRQKRILDIAADNPGATLAEIAERIPSVSADHVDRVLDQYGDPAASGESDATQSASGSPDADANDDASGEFNASPPDHAPAEAADQTNEPISTSDAEPDSSKTTETTVSTSLMDSDTESEPTESVAEPEPESASDEPGAEPEAAADPTDPVAEPNAEAEPSDASTETVESDADAASSADETVPDPEDLTQKERETLRAISYEPTATQEQIAEMLSISRATVSNRVNAIPGFEWADRGSFVEGVFDEHITVETPMTPNDDGSAVAQNAGKEPVADGASSSLSDQPGGDSLPQEPPSSAPDGVVDGPAPTESASQTADQNATTDSAATGSENDLEDISHQLEDVAQRLATMEQEIQGPDETDEASLLSDTDLVHKVVYACMNSDRITEEEELQILDTLMS